MAVDEEKKRHKQDEASLFELRLKINEEKLMVRGAKKRGVAACVLLDFVILCLTWFYDVLLHGLVGMFVLTVGTLIYLSSYSSRIEKWRLNLESEVREIEKGLYLEDVEDVQDVQEGLSDDEEPGQ